MVSIPARSRANDFAAPTTRAARWIVGLALVLASTVLGPTLAPGAAHADPATGISIVDGVTAPVFDYASAIRERVFIPVQGVDQDLDGVDDVTVIDIIRPAESDGDLKVPAIIDPSPYYTTIGRGNESEHLADTDNDGINDHFPLYYDNYFVPRGYAVILAQMDGTGFSTGCPLHGGPGDIASMKVVIDWLQGRVAGYDAAHTAVTATWTNGKAAMIGKSYDGTLANGVAATGVEGLTTIVPIDAITDWYRYSRTGGIRHNTNYPSGLSKAVTNPDRVALCGPPRLLLDNIDGDETGDINEFWNERDYLNDVDNVTASVFAVHGLNDDNVRMDQLGPYWQALTDRGVPRKIWLAKTGHVDPFDYRRQTWVDTLHRWFDYWLQGVDNGIMDEPMATVETDPGVFEDYANWPVPGTEAVDVYLAGGAEAGDAGQLLVEPGSGIPSLAFTGTSSQPPENSLINNPDGPLTSRLMFLSTPLENDLRISGTTVVQLHASLDKAQSNLAAFLVDYGPATRTPRNLGAGEGVHNTTVRTCWGEQTDADNACYLEVERSSSNVSFWRVSRGVLDSSNRDTLIAGDATPVVPGQAYDFDFPLEPYDHTFPAGHRIGVVITTNVGTFVAGTLGTAVTVDATTSRIILPVVGGLKAAAVSAGLGEPAPVTLDFDLGSHGATIPPQTVAYNTAPTAPVAPSEHGWVLQGWYTDAQHTTAFDFDTAITANATAYAGWVDIADVVDTLEIVPSTTSVTQGDSITVAVTGFDAAGDTLGDVTDLVDLKSSVSSDEFEGSTITFVHASPHLITATLGTATASVSISVDPPPVVVEPSQDGSLSLTGTTTALPLLLLALVLALVGAGLVIVRRRRTAVSRRAE